MEGSTCAVYSCKRVSGWRMPEVFHSPVTWLYWPETNLSQVSSGLFYSINVLTF